MSEQLPLDDQPTDPELAPLEDRVSTDPQLTAPAERASVDLHADLQELDPRAVSLWRISGAIGALIWGITLGGMLVAVGLLTEVPLWVSLAGVGAGIAALAVLRVGVIPPIRYRLWRYRLGEDQLFLQRGFLVVRRTLIPLVRVQNVDTVQGPIARRFGLWSVVVYTAANAQSIPALSQEQADRLRGSIAELARRAKDED